MRPSSLYRLEIAPLVMLPLGRSALFSYLSDAEIPLGSLVRMPFGRREIEGIVYACQPFPGRAPQWMKHVSHVVLPAHLTEEQRALAETISEEYFTPLGKTLKHFLPKRSGTREKRKTEARPVSALRAAKDEAAMVKVFSKASPDKACFLDPTGLADPKHALSLLAKKAAGKSGQALILVPEITLIPGFEDAFLRFFPKRDIAVLHSQLSDGQYWETWERIRSGEAKHVIATRQGLFAPWKRLALIAVTEEQDESYKQWDMSPRYDARRAAASLAHLHGARLLSVSETPSLLMRRNIAEKAIVPLRPLSITPPFGASLTVVNLRLERFRKNYSTLSEMLVTRLHETLGRGGQALLYIHRQGMSAFSVCEDCKEVLRCQECGKAMTGAKDGSFRCLGCGWKTGFFPKCPKCGHLSFRNIGFGTERIERDVERLFPGARVFRADSSTMRRPKAARELHDLMTASKIDILIGTQMILKDFSLPKLSLIGMIDADSLLSFPDFRSDERFYQHLERAVKRVGPERVILQTFHPESAFLQHVSAYDSDRFAERLLADREGLEYPPFSRLVAVSYRDSDPEKAEQSAKKAFESLKKAFAKQGLPIRQSPPRPARLVPRKKLHESSFLLRIPDSSALPYSELRALAKEKNCIIDVDPIAFY